MYAEEPGTWPAAQRSTPFGAYPISRSCRTPRIPPSHRPKCNCRGAERQDMAEAIEIRARIMTRHGAQRPCLRLTAEQCRCCPAALLPCQVELELELDRGWRMPLRYAAGHASRAMQRELQTIRSVHTAADAKHAASRQPPTCLIEDGLFNRGSRCIIKSRCIASWRCSGVSTWSVGLFTDRIPDNSPAWASGTNTQKRVETRCTKTQGKSGADLGAVIALLGRS